MSLTLPAGMQVTGTLTPEFAQLLTPEALAFVAGLHRAFEPRRQELLALRAARQREFDAGKLPDFLPETRAIRESAWTVAAQAGSLLAFGGADRHKGYALSLMVQTFGLLAGAAIPHGRPRDFGHLIIAFKPDLLMPLDTFRQQVDQLIAEIKATPTRDGVDAVRIPSERAFRERDRARQEGLDVDRKVVESLRAMAEGRPAT